MGTAIYIKSLKMSLPLWPWVSQASFPINTKCLPHYHSHRGNKRMKHTYYPWNMLMERDENHRNVYDAKSCRCYIHALYRSRGCIEDRTRSSPCWQLGVGQEMPPQGSGIWVCWEAFRWRMEEYSSQRTVGLHVEMCDFWRACWGIFRKFRSGPDLGAWMVPHPPGCVCKNLTGEQHCWNLNVRYNFPGKVCGRASRGLKNEAEKHPLR